MDLIRVSATAAGLNYYPEFLARELGFFGDEGLEVRTEAPGHGPWVVKALLDGDADIALGGIWRPLMYRQGLTTLTPFAQLCHRCPAVLLATAPTFDLRDLPGKRIAVDGTAPTPLMAFERLLHREGIDPRSVTFLQNFLASEAADLFTGGVADYLLVGTPAGDRMVAAGYSPVVDLAATFGPVPWSVYYSLPAFLRDPRNLAGRFARAISGALAWIQTHEPEEAPGVFTRHFPNDEHSLLADGVKRLRDVGMWSSSVAIDMTALSEWQVAIAEFGLTRPQFRVDDLVDQNPARRAETG